MFCLQFSRETGIAIEPVYTGKCCCASELCLGLDIFAPKLGSLLFILVDCRELVVESWLPIERKKGRHTVALILFRHLISTYFPQYARVFVDGNRLMDQKVSFTHRHN